MTSGIISAVVRSVQSNHSPFSILKLIKTDASLNLNYSGGPLLNRAGEVIGINTQLGANSKVNASIGFAIPINTGKQVVSTIVERNRLESVIWQNK